MVMIFMHRQTSIKLLHRLFPHNHMFRVYCVDAAVVASTSCIMTTTSLIQQVFFTRADLFNLAFCHKHHQGGEKKAQVIANDH